MRAWYGKGRYWFAVAASSGASLAWGWYGYAQRWEPLGYEFADWVETDFAQAIDFAEIPAELIATLTWTLDARANARVSRARGSDRRSTVPTSGTYH